jgi:hypothetical protein
METTVQTYRRRAADYRNEAALSREPEIRPSLLMVADSYDRLAEGEEKKNKQ